MNHKWKRRLLSLFAGGAMLAAVGCESVGGVDLNKAITSMYEVESSVGVMSIDWELAPDEKTLTDEDTEKMLELFGSGSLTITEARQENMQKASYEGAIELKKGSIPFTLYLEDNVMIFDVEGAKKPFELNLQAMAGNDPTLEVFGGKTVYDFFGPEENMELTKALVSFIVSHLDNPKDTSVSKVSETIDGQTKTLTKVTANVGLEEMPSLLSSALAGIAEDEEGFIALLGTLYDILSPMIQEYAKENPEDSFLSMALNKELTVQFIYSMVAPELKKAAEELSESTGFGSGLTGDSGVSFELLLDGSEPVGLDAALFIAPDSEDTDGVKSFSLGISSRWWDINEKVDAATYEGDTYPIAFDVKPRHRLDNIEKTSLIYDILKNDFHVTQYTFDMYMGTNASQPDGVSPYIKGEGTTMVPARFVSEQLDANVGWDPATETITVKDPYEDITIVMKIGDKTATVNGAAQTLPEAPEIVNGSTFVPIAFITKALGGETNWNATYGVVTITKEF